jgi:hypothetical protein
METRENALTHLSVQRTLAVVEQALLQSGAVIRRRESNRVLARTRASGDSPDAEIEIAVEACYERNLIVMVGRPRDASTDSGQGAINLRPLVESIKGIEDDVFPEGWQLFGELLIHSGTLRIADPTDFSDAVKIEGIPSALYPLYCQRERTSAEFAYPHLKRIRLRTRPGPVDSRHVFGTTLLRFPGLLNGIAILGDEEDYEEHWSEIGYRERFITEVIRRPDALEAVVRDFFGDVLAIHSDSMIDLGEGIADYADRIRSDQSGTDEPMDDSDIDMFVRTVGLFGGGELRFIEFEL